MIHDAGLFQRNLDAISTHCPDVHAQLRAITEPLSSVIKKDGEVVDVDLRGGNTLYKGDARQETAEQVKTYLLNPFQIGYILPSENNYDSLVSRAIHQGMVDSLARRGVEELPLKPTVRTGYAFILGVGLGYHLPLLVEQLSASHFILCEPFAEFLRASMDAVDWTALLRRCAELGKTLDIVCVNSVDEMFSGIGKVVGKYGQAKLDGSYFYEHYPLWMLQELRRRLSNELPRQMLSLGYFEDERKMVRNAAVNLHTGTYRVMDGMNFRPRGDIPVFLVGAGPSIDDCIDTVREFRDSAIVFSSGTALQVCLKNGIIPDYHTEIENTYDIHRKLKFILDENKHLFPDGKYKGVRLIGSTTLNPQVAPLFEDVYLFFREAVSSTTSFGHDFRPMNGVAPTVANTSVSVAARLGFGDIYLFGFDCGWRDDTVHHTKDSIYYTADGFKNARMSGDLTLPGNFGGVIQSSLVFDWSRNMLVQAISAFHLNVYNCSDGVLIDGATPKVAEAVVLPNKIDRAKMLAAIEADCRSYAAGEFFRDHDFDGYLAELEWYRMTVTGVLRTAAAERWDYEKFAEVFLSALKETKGDARFQLSGIIHFSVNGAMQQSSQFFHRISDEEKRIAVACDFYEIFGRQIEQMAGESRQIVLDIKDWIAGGPEPVWKLGMPTMPGHSY